MNDPHMVAPVDGDADDGADDPVIGKRLRPTRIHVECRDGRGRRTHGGDRRNGADEDGLYEAALLHARHYRRSLPAPVLLDCLGSSGKGRMKSSWLIALVLVCATACRQAQP